MREEAHRIQGMMPEQHRGVAQARDCRHGQQRHHDDRVSHAEGVALGLSDPLVEVATLRGVVVGDDLSQKRGFTLVIVRLHGVVLCSGIRHCRSTRQIFRKWWP